MLAGTARLRSPAVSGIAIGVTWVCASLALGGVFAYSAFAFNPWLLPAAALLLALAAVSLSRPEVGIAAAFVMIILGNFGLAGQPPWLLATAWSGFLAVLAISREGVHPDTEHGAWLGRSLLLFLSAAVPSLLIGATISAALPVFRSLVTGLLLFFAIRRLIRTREQVAWVLAGAALGASAIGAQALVDFKNGVAAASFFTESGDVVTRAAAGFGEANSLGGFLVVVVPFLVAGLLSFRSWRPLFAIALVLSVIGVYVSFSRGALIGLALIPFIFLRARWSLVAIPVAILGFAIASPELVRERFATASAQGPEVATRLDFWRAAETIWTDNPVVGVGLGGFPDAYATTPLPNKQFLPDTRFEPPPHAHNLFLNTLAEEGVLGFVALLAVGAAVVATTLRQRRDDRKWVSLMGRAGLTSLAAASVHGMFDVTLLEQTGTYFWALLGVVSATATIAARDGGAQGAGRDAQEKDSSRTHGAHPGVEHR